MTIELEQIFDSRRKHNSSWSEAVPVSIASAATRMTTLHSSRIHRRGSWLDRATTSC